MERASAPSGKCRPATMVSTETTKSAPWGTSSRAASSPMPSSTPDLGALSPLMKKRRMRSNSPGSGSIFARPQLLRGPIQDGIDELVPIRRTKLLGQLHRFIECHAVWQLGVRLQFMQAKPQNRMLDGIEFRRCDLAQSRQPQVQCFSIGGDGLD